MISPITFNSSILSSLLESPLPFDSITTIIIIIANNIRPIEQNRANFCHSGHSPESILFAIEPASAIL